MNRQKKGISVVLTTLIIVVASVVLGTAVAVFGNSLFQSGAQQQGMSVTNTHLWYQQNTTAPKFEGAFVVRNSGDKVIAVDGIDSRGVLTAFSSWEVNTSPSTAQMTAQYTWRATVGTHAAGTATTYNVDGQGTNVVLTAQSGPISLNPGQAAIVYFSLSATQTSLTASDIGTSVSFKITAGQITSVQSVSLAVA